MLDIIVQLGNIMENKVEMAHAFLEFIAYR